MPPPSSQKGTGKKGGAGAVRQQQQRSRNTTPSAVPAVANLPPVEHVETETLELRFEVLRNLTYEDMVDPAASNTVTPDSKSLEGLLSRLQRLGEIVDKRGTNCDRGMRLLAQNRRLRMDEMAAERGREEERRQKEADDEERERKANKKQIEREEKANTAMELERVKAERDVALKEMEILKSQVGDLQAQNTALVAVLGRAGLLAGDSPGKGGEEGVDGVVA